MRTKRAPSLAQSLPMLSPRLTFPRVLPSLIFAPRRRSPSLARFTSRHADMFWAASRSQPALRAPPFPLRTLDLWSGTNGGDQVT